MVATCNIENKVTPYTTSTSQRIAPNSTSWSVDLVRKMGFLDEIRKGSITSGYMILKGKQYFSLAPPEMTKLVEIQSKLRNKFTLDYRLFGGRVTKKRFKDLEKYLTWLIEELRKVKL